MDWGLAGQIGVGVGAVLIGRFMWWDYHRSGHEKPGIIEPSKPWPRCGRQDAPGATITRETPQELRRCGSCGQEARELHHYLDASVCTWCHNARERRRDVERHIEGMG